MNKCETVDGLVGGPCRETQVAIEMQSLSQYNHRLSDTISDLCERLKPVVRSEPPGAPNKIAHGEVSDLVPLALSLCEQRLIIDCHIKKLDHLMAALEV